MIKFFTEFIGTFLFLSVNLMSGGNPTAIGLALVAVIFMGAHISGGIYNPAGSIMMYMKGVLSTKTTIGYIISQILGGLCALLYYNSTKQHSPITKYENILFKKLKTIL